LPGAGQIRLGVNRIEDNKQVEIDFTQIHTKATPEGCRRVQNNP
jgi:hypothetical protein